jgi:hypothetical protein
MPANATVKSPETGICEAPLPYPGLHSRARTAVKMLVKGANGAMSKLAAGMRREACARRDDAITDIGRMTR